MAAGAVAGALLAAALFGATTPLAKLLLGSVSGTVLAGLLYLGSGVGLAAWWLCFGSRAEAPLRARDLPWLLGAIACGGVAGPLLLMRGLATTPAASASLLLNLEGVLTALMAWVVFREGCDRRVVTGMVLIVLGGVVLSWPASGRTGTLGWGSALVALAALAWAVDNNLTRAVSGGDPVQVAMAKGLAAGTVNLALGLLAGSALPPAPLTIAAATVGFLGYGVSLVLFVVALRHLGTARTSAYFSVAPFIGVAVAVVVFTDPLTWQLAAAGLLMAGGVYLHLTEHHGHEHHHHAVEHEHVHTHDDHHHDHDHAESPATPHAHWHAHPERVHGHPHYPDIHHRHTH